MSVLGRLASALGRNDERPNVELAEELATKPDAAAIAELAGALSGAVAVANDAIKVLYEIGARRPELVAPHLPAFLALLGSKNNRNVWGALQAVESVTDQVPAAVHAALPAVLAAADKGSVIAKDKAVRILVKLAAAGHRDVVPTLLQRVEEAAPNQFPTYAEETARVLDAAGRGELAAILERRVGSIETPSKRVRVEKLLKRLG
jgi:hypothetical protein